MGVSFTLTDDEYDVLINALSVYHSHGNVNTYRSELISKLPEFLFNDVNKITKVIDNYEELKNTKKPDLFIRQLITIDTSKQSQSSKVNTEILSSILKDIFKEDNNLACTLRDLVFNSNSVYKFPGYLIKNILAEALADVNLSNDNMFQTYKKIVCGTRIGAGSHSIKIFEKILHSDLKYSKDIELLNYLGSQKSRRVAMIALSLADDKILPYLVTVKNKYAREAIIKRMNA